MSKTINDIYMKPEVFGASKDNGEIVMSKAINDIYTEPEMFGAYSGKGEAKS